MPLTAREEQWLGVMIRDYIRAHCTCAPKPSLSQVSSDHAPSCVARMGLEEYTKNATDGTPRTVPLEPA